MVLWVLAVGMIYFSNGGSRVHSDLVRRERCGALVQNLSGAVDCGWWPGGVLDRGRGAKERKLIEYKAAAELVLHQQDDALNQVSRDPC